MNEPKQNRFLRRMFFYDSSSSTSNILIILYAVPPSQYNFFESRCEQGELIFIGLDYKCRLSQSRPKNFTLFFLHLRKFLRHLEQNWSIVLLSRASTILLFLRVSYTYYAIFIQVVFSTYNNNYKELVNLRLLVCVVVRINNRYK